MEDIRYPRRKGIKRSVRVWRVFWISLLFLLIVGVMSLETYRLVRGVQYWSYNRKTKQSYVQEIEKLQKTKQSLREEIHKLKENNLAQERLAREMGYVRPGEIVYKFIPKTGEMPSTSESSLMKE